MPASIRELAPAELSTLEALVCEVFGAGDRPRGWFERKLAREVVDPALSKIALDRRGRPIGFLLASAPPSLPGVARLVSLGVLPTSRSHGIGRALIDAAATTAAAVGLRTMTALAEADRRSFYADTGFSPEAVLQTLLAPRSSAPLRPAPTGAGARLGGVLSGSNEATSTTPTTLEMPATSTTPPTSTTTATVAIPATSTTPPTSASPTTLEMPATSATPATGTTTATGTTPPTRPTTLAVPATRATPTPTTLVMPATSATRATAAMPTTGSTPTKMAGDAGPADQHATIRRLPPAPWGRPETLAIGGWLAEAWERTAAELRQTYALGDPPRVWAHVSREGEAQLIHRLLLRAQPAHEARETPARVVCELAQSLAEALTPDGPLLFYGLPAVSPITNSLLSAGWTCVQESTRMVRRLGPTLATAQTPAVDRPRPPAP